MKEEKKEESKIKRIRNKKIKKKQEIKGHREALREGEIENEKERKKR